MNLKELNSIMNILEDNALAKRQFENIATSFHHCFNKQDHFRIGCSLVLLLQNEDLLPEKEQRLVVVFLLYEMYRTEPIQANPFASVFVHLLHPPEEAAEAGASSKRPWALPKLSNSEKHFLSQLISMPTKDLFKKNSHQILQMDVSDLQSFDVSGLQVALAERHSEMSQTSKSGIPALVQIEDDRPSASMEDLNLKATREGLLTGDEAKVHLSRKPEFIRIAPPTHPFDDEMLWMHMGMVKWHRVQWDTAMGISCGAGVEAKRLMLKAFKAPLSPPQQQLLLREVEADAKLVYHVGLSPAKLPDLVEHNPYVAFEVLRKVGQSSSQVSEYYTVLVNMEMSLQSMDVVNRLTTSLDLPRDFVHQYISNCINTCQNISIKEKFMQARLIRLICVFLQSLIRNNVIDMRDLFIEIQAFCIEYSHIKEATALFRLLKQIDCSQRGEASAEAPAPPKADKK